MRELLRKRAHLGQQRARNVLSVQSLMCCSEGARLEGGVRQGVERGAREANHAAACDVGLAMGASVAMIKCVEEQRLECIEEVVLGRVKLRKELRLLTTAPSIGEIVALMIMFETGAVSRFASVGDLASYRGCVGSTGPSNEKEKGEGNVENGNRYLAWAFVGAAKFAIRSSAPIQRWYQCKQARRMRSWGSRQWRTSWRARRTTSCAIR